jgi:aminoglycoside phosphotransferase (APT) family kinase protein
VSDSFLPAKLRAILAALRSDVKPDLSAPNAKLRAELIDMLLSRLLVEADGGDPGLDVGSGTISAVAAHEAQRRIAYEEKVVQTLLALPLAKGSASELALAPENFTNYLRRRFPEDPLISADSVSVVAGGRSKATLLIDLSTSDGPKQIVLRRDFELSVTGTSVDYEFPILKAARHAGVRVPEPLWLENDSTVIGGKFIAFERLPGKAMGTLFVSDASPAFASAFAAELARVHAIDIDEAAIGEQLHFGGDAHPVRAMIKSFRTRYKANVTPEPLMDAAFAWLFEQLPAIGNERALVHGDAGLHNALGVDDTLTALLDWEFAHAGDPAEDLTYCKYLVERILPWADFMAAYIAAGGKPVSAARMRFFTIWRTLHLAILTGAARTAFESGADQDLRIAAIGYTTFPRQLRDLATDLAAFTGGLT